MAMLRAVGLEKKYQSGAEEIRALKGVDFEINKGDFTIINGPSGSGKTTLLNLLSGIDQPSSGKVYIDDIALSRYSDRERTILRREKIGLVFQSFELIPVLTAYENVEYPLLLQKVNRKKREKRVMGLLEEVGLSEMAGRRPEQLSGGQKQRVAIARALISRPEIVLADEPTGNLDTKTGKRIIELMLKLNKQHGVAFIIVTHDLFINEYAKRLLQIRDGNLEVLNNVEDCLA